MREIKLQAFNSEDKEMYSDEVAKLLLYKESVGEPIPEKWEIRQFTGLKDNNGKDAYYGDIIVHSTTEGGIFRRVISWSDELQCTMIDNMPYYRLHESGYIQPSKLEFEIIGNIHQNPELLVSRTF